MEALTSDFPAHKATQPFTTRDAIIHTIPKHSKAINLEGYYFFLVRGEPEEQQRGPRDSQVTPSRLEFPPTFPPFLGHHLPPPASLEPGHQRQHQLGPS